MVRVLGHDRTWKNYGGRGIRVCKEWENFLNFKKDMHQSYLVHIKKYGKNTLIDRIDNDGNYERKNCRWVTHKESNLNKRKRVYKK